MSAEQAAAFLQWNLKSLYERAAQGLVPHRRLGRRYFFLREELVTFIAGLPGVTVEQALADCRRFVERRTDMEGR